MGTSQVSLPFDLLGQKALVSFLRTSQVSLTLNLLGKNRLGVCKTPISLTRNRGSWGFYKTCRKISHPKGRCVARTSSFLRSWSVATQKSPASLFQKEPPDEPLSPLLLREVRSLPLKSPPLLSFKKKPRTSHHLHLFSKGSFVAT